MSITGFLPSPTLHALSPSQLADPNMHGDDIKKREVGTERNIRFRGHRMESVNLNRGWIPERMLEALKSHNMGNTEFRGNLRTLAGCCHHQVLSSMPSLWLFREGRETGTPEYYAVE